MRALIRTDNNYGSLVLRLALGVMMLPHGLQKTVSAFDGAGFSATMTSFQNMGFPWFLALLAIIAESLGALGVLLGFLTRVAAFGIACVMAVAAWTVHWDKPFFSGEGIQLHILAVGIALALMIQGGGALSIDRKLTHAS